MINPFHIIKIVEEKYFLPKNTLTSPKRTKAVAEARAVAMYLCRLHTPYSYLEIGNHFNRHHSTVVHDVDKAKRLIAAGYPIIKQLVSELS